MPLGLTINPNSSLGLRAGPRTPTLIQPVPLPRVHFGTLDALAARLHVLRGANGIQFKRAVATLDGSDTFPIFNVEVLTEGADEGRWIGAIAIQTDTLAVIEHAMRRTDPNAAENRGLAA